MEGEMTVERVLKEALEAVEGAQVPQHLQGIAFEFALNHLAGTRTPSSTTGEPDRQEVTPHRATVSPPNEQYDLLDKLAQRIKVARETVAEVFHEEDNQLKLMVASRKLDQSKNAATQQIA